MVYIIAILLLLIAIFLEGSITSLPFVFVILLCLSIVTRGRRVFPIAFASGLLLDLLTLHPLGASSMFFLIVLLLVQQYQRKYEIYSYPFVMVSAFLGSLLYLWLFGYNAVFLQSLLSVFIAGIVFTVFRYIPHGMVKLKTV